MQASPKRAGSTVPASHLTPLHLGLPLQGQQPKYPPQRRRPPLRQFLVQNNGAIAVVQDPFGTLRFPSPQLSSAQVPAPLPAPTPPDLKVVGEMPRQHVEGAGSKTAATTAVATAAVGTDVMVSTPTQTPDGLNKLGCNSQDNNTATTSMTMVNAPA